HRIRALGDERMTGVVGLQERVADVAVGDGITRGDQRPRIAAEDRDEGARVVRPRRGHERLGGLFGRREAPWQDQRRLRRGRRRLSRGGLFCWRRRRLSSHAKHGGPSECCHHHDRRDQDSRAHRRPPPPRPPPPPPPPRLPPPPTPPSPLPAAGCVLGPRPRNCSRAWLPPGPVRLKRCCVALSRYCTPLRCSGLCCHLPRPPSPPWFLRCSTRFFAVSLLFTRFEKLL